MESGTRAKGAELPIPAETPLGRDIKAFLLLVAGVTLVTGLTLVLAPNVAGVGSVDATTQRPLGDQFWPWSLRTEFTSRFVGAFFLSVGTGAVLALRERSWEHIRILFPVAIVFTALGTLIALIHFASFNRARLATWLFLGLYLLVLLGEVVSYVRYERRRNRNRRRVAGEGRAAQARTRP